MYHQPYNSAIRVPRLLCWYDWKHVVIPLFGKAPALKAPATAQYQQECTLGRTKDEEDSCPENVASIAGTGCLLRIIIGFVVIIMSIYSVTWQSTVLEENFENADLGIGCEAGDSLIIKATSIFSVTLQSTVLASLVIVAALNHQILFREARFILQLLVVVIVAMIVANAVDQSNGLQGRDGTNGRSGVDSIGEVNRFDFSQGTYGRHGTDLIGKIMKKNVRKWVGGATKSAFQPTVNDTSIDLDDILANWIDVTVHGLADKGELGMLLNGLITSPPPGFMVGNGGVGLSGTSVHPRIFYTA